jgi:hypothetical protein
MIVIRDVLFKAWAEESRRELLHRLYQSNGRTLERFN